MRTVFDNSMVAHVWAQRRQAHGRSANGHFYFDGNELFSYGRHFCVARFVQFTPKRGAEKTCVFLNSDSYSVSTSRHQSYARGAISGLGLPVFTMPGAGMRGDLLRYKGSHAENLAHYARRIADLVEKAKRARKNASWHEAEAAVLAGEARAYCEFFEISAKDFATLDAACALVEKDKRKAERARKAAEKARKQREAEQRARDAEWFGEWQRGERDNCPHSYAYAPDGSTYLRVKGDELQTSRGASVPLSHAIRVFRFIKLCRERGEAFHANGRAIRVGHFTVDSIDAHGNMIAGCHRMSWEQIEFAARQAGVFEYPAEDNATEESRLPVDYFRQQS